MFVQGGSREPEGWKTLEAWEQLVTSTYAGLTVAVDRKSDFSARLSLVNVGRCQLTTVDSAPAAYERSELHVARAPADDLLLSLKLSGSCTAEQYGRQAVLEAGDLVLYDTSSPYKLEFPDPYRELVLKIPRAALASRISSAPALSAIKLSRGSALARLAGSYLRELAREAVGLSPAARGRLDSAMLDVLALALSEVTAPEAADEHLEKLVRAKDMMRAQMSDSNLDASRVAAALNISVRTLNRLFAREGESAMRWLLDERLNTCHRALSEGQSKTVSDVAFEYGFIDHSYFSRAFKAKFGTRPREIRMAGHIA